MRLEDLAPLKGARSSRKRVGRGTGSGLGKTAGRGTKGQKSRSGGGTAPWFEGGQMPLQRRVPKRGFTNLFKKTYSIVNVSDLERFEGYREIGPKELLQTGLLKTRTDGIKLLADGDVTHPFIVRVHKASTAAINKVQAAGGSVELIPLHNKRN
jgi:large subunit ribosomal protein L15